MSQRRAANRPADVIARQVELLKRVIVNIDRAGGDRSRQITLLYRAADTFGRKIFPVSFCQDEIVNASGCKTGMCCRCRPDVFSFEKDVLDLLPKRVDDSGFCPFFNLARKNCGIYAVRPLACRLYFNLATSTRYCQNPTDATLDLFDALRRHVEKVLGPYQGGYRYLQAASHSAAPTQGKAE